MPAPFHQQLVTLAPLVEARLDPDAMRARMEAPAFAGAQPVPDNPAIARTVSGQQVALTPQPIAS